MMTLKKHRMSDNGDSSSIDNFSSSEEASFKEETIKRARSDDGDTNDSIENYGDTFDDGSDGNDGSDDQFSDEAFD
jgi:hypothetical protein